VTTAGSVSGELQLTNPVPVPYCNYIPDGDMIGYSNGGTISQTVAGTSITTGTVYTLTVAVGSRLDCCDIAPTVELVDPSNNAILAVATGLAPAPGNWSDWSGTYTGAAANAGHPLEIELISNGVQGDFDNVRLNQTATTPEPASLALMGLGLVGIAAVLGRRVRSPGPVKNDF
jgi:hypothetical protein